MPKQIKKKDVIKFFDEVSRHLPRKPKSKGILNPVLRPKLLSSEVAVLLDCNHEIRCHARSSIFDFPDDEVYCGRCNKLSHLNAGLRKRLKEARKRK